MNQLVFLWTDILIFFLVFMTLGFVWYARRRETLRRPWAQVVRNRLAMASMIILMVYLVIGLLDSMHYRKALPVQEGQTVVQFSGEVVSVLDWVLGPMSTQVEKTYSAPMSAFLFSRETVVDKEGVQQRVFPRLQFGGAHLKEPDAEKAKDITMRMGNAFLSAMGVMFAIIILLATRISRKRSISIYSCLVAMKDGDLELPWRTAMFTLFLIVLAGFLMSQLSSVYHILGTDKVGQDVLYQTIKSIRTGLLIGTLTTLVMLPFAVVLGMMAGYFRGWIDDVIQYLYTTLNSIPGVLLIAAAVLMLQVYMANHPDMFETMAERADMRLLFLCLILGITSWTGLCRLLRAETLKLRELEYVQAAQAFGTSKFKILLQHLLPNLFHLVLIAIVLDFSGLVLAEAVLSYVGVGVDPSMLSWGNMINRARLEMAREPLVWWSLLAAFSFMFTMVLSANLFSDAVRDAFDPRLRDQV